MKVWRSTWVILGLIVGAIGALFFIANGSNHSACSSILISGSSACQSVNDRYYGGIVALVVGVVLVIAGAASGGSRSKEVSAPPGASPWPAGWYVDRNKPTIERWWNGAAWTDYTRERQEPPKPEAPTATEPEAPTS
jgi:hypothetical protein